MTSMLYAMHVTHQAGVSRTAINHQIMVHPTLSVANALNWTYGMVLLTETVGGLEQVIVGPTNLTSAVIILVNNLDQCMEPCTPKL